MTLPTTTKHRGFDLHVKPATAGGVTVTLVEFNGHPDRQRRVAALPASRYDKASDALAAALERSGHRPAALTGRQNGPLELEEAAGVRLALTLAAIDGIRKPGRTRALIDGVNRLSAEERLYWYAAALSDSTSAPRRLRALRLYLADD